jgi:hypothetical protein
MYQLIINKHAGRDQLKGKNNTSSHALPQPPLTNSPDISATRSWKSLLCSGIYSEDISAYIAAVSLEEPVCLEGNCSFTAQFEGPFPQSCDDHPDQGSVTTKFQSSQSIYPYALVYKNKKYIEERFNINNNAILTFKQIISGLKIEGE